MAKKSQPVQDDESEVELHENVFTSNTAKSLGFF